MVAAQSFQNLQAIGQGKFQNPAVRFLGFCSMKYQSFALAFLLAMPAGSSFAFHPSSPPAASSTYGRLAICLRGPSQYNFCVVLQHSPQLMAWLRLASADA
jgi:hypothetical protein